MNTCFLVEQCVQGGVQTTPIVSNSTHHIIIKFSKKYAPSAPMAAHSRLAWLRSSFRKTFPLNALTANHNVRSVRAQGQTGNRASVAHHLSRDRLTTKLPATSLIAQRVATTRSKGNAGNTGVALATVVVSSVQQAIELLAKPTGPADLAL